ncbi:MAG: TetR/AcrR family transcriptional regulator [Solirubrobacteraceae bacterium]|nr:TetR/AcrR family transcriptional regulator [Solirubrobacteraceae bacterium]
MHSVADFPSHDPAPAGTGRSAPSVEMRARLVDALADVIDADGYGPSRVRDVARLARVSLTTFYLAFPTKQECLVALAARSEQQAAAWIADRSASATEPWPEAVEAIIRDGLRLVLKRPRVAYAVLAELAGLEESGRRAWRDALEGLAAAIAAGVVVSRAAVGASTELRLGDDAAAFVAGGLIEGLIGLIIESADADHRAARIDALAATAAHAISRLAD